MSNRAQQELQTSQQWQAWANHYRSLDPNSPQVAQCDQLAQQHYNQHVQLTNQAHAAYNGTFTQNQSQTLQGAQWTYANTDSGPLLSDPNPVDGRPYNQRGGLRPPLQQHQTDLVQRMPRNPDGSFVVNPDPRVGDWLSVANDGGPNFDPARGINCLDCMVSFWESWRGTPRVSAPRTYDSYEGTNPLAINRGEEHGMARAAALTGGQWQSFMPSMNPPQQRTNLPAAQTQQFVDWGYQGIDAQLRNMGPGSAMFIVTEWEGGSSHAWIAINQGGEIVYVDAQSGQTSTDSPLYAHTGNPNAGNVSAIHGIPLDSNGNAQIVPNLGNNVAQMEQYLANQVQQQQAPQQPQTPQTQQAQTQQAQTQTQQTNQNQQSSQQQTNTQQSATQPGPQQNQTQAQNAQTQQQPSPDTTQQIPVQQQASTDTTQPLTVQPQTNADTTQQLTVQPQPSPDTMQQIPVQQQASTDTTQPLTVQPQTNADVTQQVTVQQSPEVTQQIPVQQANADVTQTVSPDLTQSKVDLQKAQPAPDTDQTQQIPAPQQQSTPDPRVAFQQGTPPPPQQPPAAPPRPHRPPDPAGLAPGSVPFGYEEFFNDPRWAGDALRFEQALGAYLFNSPEVLQTARDSVIRLRDAMTALAAIDPAITPADIERAFCPDVTDFNDPSDLTASAGQAGPEASLDDLLERGNVRELMTAFFNAAYNFRQGSTLGNMVQQAIESGNYDAAIAAGLDVDLLRRIKAELDISEDYRDREEFRHRSIFTVGTVNLLSDHAMWDFYETVRSHDGRNYRTPEQQEAISNTPQHYADLGTPLGEFERAFLERVMGAQLEPDTRLPWREGHTLFDTQSEWVHIMEARGFPTAAGISMTTTRMLTVARMLDMDPAQQQAFMDALMAWMLPCRDHSLAEIYRAAMVSGLERVDRNEFHDLSVVELYREMTGLDLAELRNELGIRLEPTDPPLLPHEAAYLQQVREGRFTDVTPAMMQTAQMNWNQLSTGVLLSDAEWREATGRRNGENPLRAWLERAGIDPADTEAVQAVTERLSLSHIISFTVYTGYGYGLINAAITGRMESEDAPCARRIAEAIPDADLPPIDDAGVRRETRNKAEALVQKYLDKYLERMSEPRQTPPSIAQVMQGEAGRQWVDAAHRRDEAERERDRLTVEGQHDEAHAAERRVHLADLEMDAARVAIMRELDAAVDSIVTEMKWHADMIVDGMSQLPRLGTTDNPVLVYRGDGVDDSHSELYGDREEDPGPMPKLVSTAAERQPAYIFMGNDPSITDENRVFVVYELTGQYAADISPFSVFPTQAEVLLPPGARVHRVIDPELEERLRQEVLADPALPKKVRQFKVVIMREGEAPEADND